MGKKKKYKKLSRKKWSIRILLYFLPLLLFISLALISYLWYESRAVPDLDELDQMTTLPQDMKHVLGVQTSTLSKPEETIRIPVFLYHYVEYVHNDPGRQNLNIPPNVLISQIETMKGDGYTFITPEDVTLALSGKEKLPGKPAILSFDDGYMDLYNDVFPILQKEQVKAVAYIVPNFLDRPGYLFTFQLQEIAKSPLVEIGAHTMDHFALAGMVAKTASYEIAQSRKFLQSLLHLPVNSFAYPYGSFDLHTIQLVKDAGFSNAVSVIPGILQTQENTYFLYRLRPGYRTGKGLLTYLQQNTFQPW